MTLEDFVAEAAAAEGSALRAWKGAGGRVVGYTCSYLPEEILDAAGILPFRLRGTGTEESSIGDTYFGPFICSLPKCMLQLAGEGRLRFLDGVVITPGCDSMRRLDDCWRAAGQDRPGIVPGFFFHFGAPHKVADHTVAWFAEEIRRLAAALRAQFGVPLDDDRIRASIRLYNRGRALLEELERLRSLPDPPLTGAEALAIVLAGTAMPQERLVDELAALLPALRHRGRALGGRTRLLLAGSASDDVELLRLIEGGRALVVADNLCFGSHAQLERVPEEGDWAEALSRRYLAKSECPRMYGQYPQRLASLRERIRAARVDGVVLQNIRFCDPHGAENGLLERDLEAADIPCLRLEREYGPLVERGRLRMRLDAFLERIAAHGRARA